MLNLRLLSVLEKNRLVSMRPQLLLFDIQWDPINAPTNIDYIVSDNQEFIYAGNTYYPFPIQLKAKTDKSGGELSTCVLMVSNVNRAVESEIQAVSGAVDAVVTITAIDSSLTDADPEMVQAMTVVTTNAAEDWVTFNLGMQNPARQQFPLRTYFADRCWKPYNSPALQAICAPVGAPCGYEGSIATCDRTLEGPNGCRVHNNVINFGGFPGVRVAGYRRAAFE